MGRVIALASGKGGVGKTFLTAYLADALTKRGKRVLLIDAGITNRCLDVLYGVDDRVLFDLGDALCGRCRPSQTVQQIGALLSLIPAPLREEHFAWEETHRFFHMCARDYDYVLIDCLSGAGETSVSLMRSADTVYLVVTPDLLCTKASSSLAAMLASYEDMEQGMIVNRFHSTAQKGDYSLDRLIDSVKLPCLGVIPQDNRFFAAAEIGKIITAGSVVEACGRIAARLEGIQLPLPKGRKLFA